MHVHLSRPALHADRRLLPALLLAALAACSPGGDGTKTGEEPKETAQTTPAGGSGGPGTASPAAPDGRTPIELPREVHLRDVRMLTDGGENAEAYWSWDGTRLVFQAKRGDEQCDRILVMNADGTDQKVIAAKGAHTCAYFLRNDKRVVFSSTRSGGPQCPPPPDRSQGYVWPLHPDHDIYHSRVDGSDVRRFTRTPGYDAEATVSKRGRIVFTSVRDGDLELYSMRVDGKDVRRLTHEEGYDGGAFYSPDGRKIVYRAYHPTDPQELADYRDLLSRNLVRPGRLDIWVMNADGSDKRQVTDLGDAAAFAPSFLPDGQGIIFSSNHEDPKGRNFDLYTIRLDGTGLERITWNETFDGFPLFSPDGKSLAFCSNRGNAKRGETNVFVARWVP